MGFELLMSALVTAVVFRSYTSDPSLSLGRASLGFFVSFRPSFDTRDLLDFLELSALFLLSASALFSLT